MSDSLHDTIDIKEELDEVDEILATGSLAVASAGRRTGIVELVLVTVANLIWAVVGLVLWLPQATRAVLGASLRMIHAALTQQSSARAVAGIKQVSRSYVERFLRRQGEPAFVGRRHELRPFRLIGETAWTAAFYLVVLRWLSPERFEPIWQNLKAAAANAGDWLAAAATRVKGWLLPDLASIDANRLQVAGVLLLVAFVGLVLGFWLGRRGR